MRAFSITLTAINLLYLVTGGLVWVAVIQSDDPYAGLALIPWVFGWPVLIVAAVVYLVLLRVKRASVAAHVPPGLMWATLLTSLAAFLPMGVVLGWALIDQIIPESRM